MSIQPLKATSESFQAPTILGTEALASLAVLRLGFIGLFHLNFEFQLPLQRQRQNLLVISKLEITDYLK